MKLKALCLLGFLVCSTAVWADQNHHGYPEAEGTAPQSTQANKDSAISKDGLTSKDSLSKDGLKWPGYCEIEVINDSYSAVRVYGVFDDGTMLRPFTIYTYEYPHYITLYYYGYCHAGMDIYIDTLSGYHVYAGYTPTNSTLHIVPYMTKEAPKVELVAKQKKA